MKVKISDSYQNQFISTQKGFVLKKDEIKEADEEDVELKALMEQGLVRIVKEDKIIKDSIPKNTVKEVKTEKNDPKKNLKSSKKTEKKQDDFIEE